MGPVVRSNALWFADSPEDLGKTRPLSAAATTTLPAEVTPCATASAVSKLANKHSITGPGARDWLNRTMAGHVHKPGGWRNLLTEKGRLYGDLTVALGDEDFMLFGSGAMQDAGQFRAYAARNRPARERNRRLAASASPGRSRASCCSGSPGWMSPPMPLVSRTRARWSLCPGDPEPVLSFSGELGFATSKGQFLLLLSGSSRKPGKSGIIADPAPLPCRCAS